MAREQKRERAHSSPDEPAGSASHVDPSSSEGAPSPVSTAPASRGASSPVTPSPVALAPSPRTAPSRSAPLHPAPSRVAPAAAPPSRWFEALDPNAPVTVPSRRSALGVVPLLLAAPLAFVLVPGTVLRALVAAALVFAALVVFARARKPAPPPAAGPRRGLSLRGDHLLFRGNGRSALLLTLSAPFGVTVLATPKRDRAVALLSSASGTFYVGARFDGARGAASRIFERCTTVGSEDAGLEAVGPDGEPLLLSPDDLAALVDTLLARSPACTDRFVLTDARGAALTLDGRALHLGDRQIDLASPLEWRSIVFQEAFGHAVAVYQGTWIRQGGHDVCMVCLLPSLGPTAGPDLDLQTLDRATLRDLRLMRATPEEPPPAEQRVAIERLFMLPLRSALDRAPHLAPRSNRARA